MYMLFGCRTVLTFGLNALNGRRLVGKDLYVGDWDPTNAHDLINYSLSRGYKVESWELGMFYNINLICFQF